MDLFTHFLLGMVLYNTIFGQISANLLYIAGLFAIMPDLDVFLVRPFQRLLNLKYLEHRGGSHSYIIGIGVSLLFNLVYAPLTNINFFFGWFIGILFYGLHISMDLLTTTEIPYLYPLSRKEPSFYVEKAGSGFTMILSFNLLIILVPLQIVGKDNAFRIGSYITTGFFTLYYVYRIILKIMVSKNLTASQKYFPGIFPIFYIVYTFEISSQNLVTQLEKFNIFGKSWIIYEKNTIIKDSDYLMYNQALKICNSDYYSNKWSKMPIILYENNHVSIQLAVLETLMKGRTMTQIYQFNADNHELVNHFHKYSKISKNPNIE